MTGIDEAGIEAILSCQFELKTKSMPTPEIDPVVIEDIHLRRTADSVVKVKSELLIKAVMHRGKRYGKSTGIGLPAKLDKFHDNKRIVTLDAGHEHLGDPQRTTQPDCLEAGFFSVKHRQ